MTWLCLLLVLSSSKVQRNGTPVKIPTIVSFSHFIHIEIQYIAKNVLEVSPKIKMHPSALDQHQVSEDKAVYLSDQ